MIFHKLYPKEDLVILDESEWTDFDKRIWNAFDLTMTDYANADPTPVAMCKYKNKNALLARAFSVGEGYKPNRLAYESKHFDIDLLVNSEVFTYENVDAAELSYNYNDYFLLDHVFESDGTYNLYKDVIHSDLRWCLDDICSSLDEHTIMEMFEYLGSTGHVELIADDYLRDNVKNIIKSKIKAELSTGNSSLGLNNIEWDKVKEGVSFTKLGEANFKEINIPALWEFNCENKHSLNIRRKDNDKKILETTIFDLDVYEEM
jgi:hypothetical protein